MNPALKGLADLASPAADLDRYRLLHAAREVRSVDEILAAQRRERAARAIHGACRLAEDADADDALGDVLAILRSGKPISVLLDQALARIATKDAKRRRDRRLSDEEKDRYDEWRYDHAPAQQELPDTEQVYERWCDAYAAERRAAASGLHAAAAKIAQVLEPLTKRERKAVVDLASDTSGYDEPALADLGYEKAVEIARSLAGSAFASAVAAAVAFEAFAKPADPDAEQIVLRTNEEIQALRRRESLRWATARRIHRACSAVHDEHAEDALRYALDIIATRVPIDKQQADRLAELREQDESRKRAFPLLYPEDEIAYGWWRREVAPDDAPDDYQIPHTRENFSRWCSERDETDRRSVVGLHDCASNLERLLQPFGEPEQHAIVSWASNVVDENGGWADLDADPRAIDLGYEEAAKLAQFLARRPDAERASLAALIRDALFGDDEVERP